jgi:IS30 family transposase
MVTHLSAEQRQLALRLRATGWSLRRIGPQVGCSHELVRIIARGGASRPQRGADPWVPGPGRLTLADREEISLGLHAGQACAVIAARLGKAASTVSREVAGNGGRTGYRAWRAHQRARGGARVARRSPSSRARGWPRRSPGGWRPGGRRRRSRPGRGSSSQAIP